MNKLKFIGRRKTLILLLLAFTALLLAGLSYVMAGDELLLLDAAGPVALDDTAVSRAKRVEINWSVLANPHNRRISINLFDGEIITALHDRTDRSSANNGFVWVGHVPDKGNSSVTLSVVEDVLIGSIMLDGPVQYEISRTNGQWQELRKIDPSKRIVVEGPDTLLPPPMPAQDVNKLDLCEDGSRIDLLVAYTATARVQQGGTAGIEALINERVANMNSANANSGLAFSYRLAHLMETNYEETGDLLTDMVRLQDETDGFLDDVSAAREQYLADMSALVVAQSTTHNSCGIASLMTDLSTSFAKFAYNVTALDYTDPYSCHPLTLAHEFGHNMGNNHERANAGNNTVFPYSFGYQAPTENFRTIMAYSCAGGYCPRINFWSNPDVSFAGEPTGIDHELDPDNSADNARSMEQTALYVANFRHDCEPTPTPTATSTATPTNTATPGAVAAPLLFDIENPDQDSSYTVAWSAVKEASFYQLEQNFDDTLWIESYRGPKLSVDRVDMAAGEYCYNVRARSGNRWSDWSGEKCTRVIGITNTATPTVTSTPTSTATATSTTEAPAQPKIYLPLIGK